MKANGMKGKADMAFVSARDAQFLLNGIPFYVHGFNAYFLMALSFDAECRSKVVDLLKQASQMGLNVCRTWAFNDGGYQALQTSPGVYDEKVFQALDFVLDQAQKTGVRLILSFVNNWDDYGGKRQYMEWARNAGIDLETEDAFFSDSTIKRCYKNHVKTVITRVNSITGICYKDDPTIFAWELMNEPRCACDSSGDILQAWIEEMARFVKSIDSNHLLGLGSEGFYGFPSATRTSTNPNNYVLQLGTDFLRNHQVAGIDFGGAHGYPDSWLGSEVDVFQQISFMQNWIATHILDCTSTLRKPFLLGEFGISSKHGVFKPENRKCFMETIYTMFYVSALGGSAMAGVMVWQLLPKGLENFNDGYEIVLSEDEPISQIILQHSLRLQELQDLTDTDNGVCPIKAKTQICPLKLKCCW